MFVSVIYISYTVIKDFLKHLNAEKVAMCRNTENRKCYTGRCITMHQESSGIQIIDR